ncbi:hypothetical protein FJZ27_01705 [Candidatus Peribacteria bacterium]|nr:hypothetical protein [Candidatus Peribacteria bacterium]
MSERCDQQVTHALFVAQLSNIAEKIWHWSMWKKAPKPDPKILAVTQEFTLPSPDDKPSK